MYRIMLIKVRLVETIPKKICGGGCANKMLFEESCNFNKFCADVKTFLMKKANDPQN